MATNIFHHNNVFKNNLFKQIWKKYNFISQVAICVRKILFVIFVKLKTWLDPQNRDSQRENCHHVFWQALYNTHTFDRQFPIIEIITPSSSEIFKGRFVHYGTRNNIISIKCPLKSYDSIIMIFKEKRDFMLIPDSVSNVFHWNG